MDKPLGALLGIALGVVLLTAGIYTVWQTAWNCPQVSLGDCLQTIQQTESIREDRAVLKRSIKANEDIYARLIDGRLSLTEAADALREEIESRPPHLQPALLLHERAMPRRELYMLRLLARVEEGISDNPRRGEIVRRLRAEIQAYRAALVRPVPTDPTHESAVVAAH